MKTGIKIGLALALLCGGLAAFCRYGLIMTFAAGFAPGSGDDRFVGQATLALVAAIAATLGSVGFGGWQLRQLIPRGSRPGRRQRGFVIPTAATSALGFRKFRY